MLFCVSTVWKTLKNLVLFPLRNSVVNWFVKPLNLLFCFRSVCYGCMNPTTYVWVTVAIHEFVVYRDPTGCLTAFRFSPFEVRDDSNPLEDGLSHLNRIKLKGLPQLASEPGSR